LIKGSVALKFEKIVSGHCEAVHGFASSSARSSLNLSHLFYWVHSKVIFLGLVQLLFLPDLLNIIFIFSDI